VDPAWEGGGLRTGAAVEPETIAGRYVVEAKLAAGGMGAIYRVRDPSSGGALALKRLLPNAGTAATVLFRKEYHTLVLLRHPRIIRVYDFGVEAGVPYFTMELLDGADLRALAPMSYPQACQHLRDIASSLALLHAHRILHRDVTPRNVRVTSDGRCKLLDFGALSPFGTAETLVGTAPFIPPEALRGLPLDQRADLFALGALAYHLLTGAYAYPATSLGTLENVWRRRPVEPSTLVAAMGTGGTSLEPVPEALDDLVMSLLSLDPLARPTSAAEVIERLDAIAGRVSDPGPAAAQSYLLSAEIVGRAKEIERTKLLSAQTATGAGGVLSFRHAAGAGGTRLLAEVCMEARLAGATVLQFDGEVQRGPYAVAKALVEKLTVTWPEYAREAAERDLEALSWMSTRGTHPSAPIDLAGAPGAWRVRLQSALESWVLRVARAHSLAIVVDNLHRVDEGSASLLAVLAAAAGDCPLMIVAALRADEVPSAPAAVRALVESGECLTLHSLSPRDTYAFVCSLFGDAPNSQRLSEWLYRLSGGHPLHLMELARYLVSHQVARYLDGAWALPQELPSDLPSRVEEALDSRLANLSPPARGLASALSIHDGPLSLELCVALAEAEHGDGFSAIDELTREGVLVGYGGGYRFTQRVVRERVLADVSAEEQKRLHRMLGDRLLQSSTPDVAVTLDAGWHLFHGGEEERGADILRRIGLQLVEADELPEAVPALEAAVSVYRRLGRPGHELLGLLSPLAFGGYYVDRRLADQYGDEALALFAEETGLALTVKLRPYLGGFLGLLVGLFYAFVLHFFSGRGGPRGLSQRIAMLGATSSALTGTATLCLDRPSARRRAATFEPFRALGRRHAGAFSHAFAETLVEVTEDRSAETIEKLRGLLAQLDTSGGVVGLPVRIRPITKGGVLYALGALESFMDGPLALARADELEACGLRLYDMVACRIRANYHACRGELELTREYERKVETFAVRSGSAWQAEVWAPSSKIVTCTLTSDIIGMKRAAESLEQLAREIPTLEHHARVARACLKALRGEHSSAIPLLEEVVEVAEREHSIGFRVEAAVLAASYNETAQHDRALALCTRALRGMSPGEHAIVALNLQVEIQLALAEAGLGRTDDAVRRLDDLLTTHAPGEGPVTLGSLHKARAQVALRVGDTASFEHHRVAMNTWFQSTKNPALIAQCERMAHLAKTSNRSPACPEVDAVTVYSVVRHDPWIVLAECAGPDERARRALDLALERCGATSGYLFGIRDGELAVLAASADSAAGDALLEPVRRHIAQAFDSDLVTESVDHDTDSLEPYSVHVLVVHPERRIESRGVGALVLSPGGATLNPELRDFTRALALALHEFGDVSTLRA